jgi:hypothetical protein
MDRKTKYNIRMFIFPHACLLQKQTNKKISLGQEIPCIQGTPKVYTWGTQKPVIGVYLHNLYQFGWLFN